MSLRLIILSIAFLAVFASCINEIEFDTERTEGQIVVSGSIYDRPGPYQLELGITTLESTIPIPLSGARITLFSGDGNSEQYREIDGGLYELPGNVVSGSRGQTYYIEITLPNGAIYQSIPETIPTVHSRDSTYIELENKQEQTATGGSREVPIISVYTDTHIPESSEPLYIHWSVFSKYSFRERTPSSPLAPPPNTCYVTTVPDPQAIILFSTENPGSRNIEQQLMAQKHIVSQEFYRRHYFNVISKSVTERRYNYWQQVDEIINQTGTIFDSAPATPKGNLFNPNDYQDQVFGYFEAVAIDTSRAFVTRGDLPFFVSNPCSGFNQPPACDNCLLIENSTLERPFYF